LRRSDVSRRARPGRQRVRDMFDRRHDGEDNGNSKRNRKSCEDKSRDHSAGLPYSNDDPLNLLAALFLRALPGEVRSVQDTLTPFVEFDDDGSDTATIATSTTNYDHFRGSFDGARSSRPRKHPRQRDPVFNLKKQDYAEAIPSTPAAGNALTHRRESSAVFFLDP
jgi:hypothetical protein